MKVLTKVAGQDVDATNLLALYDAFNPIVQQRIEAASREYVSSAEERTATYEALRHVTALIFAAQSKLGALVFQREAIGIADDPLRDIVDELSVALGLSEDTDPRIVVPA